MLESRSLGDTPDTTAPDGSEIRLLSTALSGSSMVHARLLSGRVAAAVRHRTVEEMWYCVAGRGSLWRRTTDEESVVDLAPGVSASIPCGALFQWRNDGDEPLDIVIATTPPWPGEDEAESSGGPWEPSV